ncbi:hypothetical protein [Bifidobacterium mongoliense]|uniref:hypothetical protein n=1 Tax=Bifidobacterium mongoliense TaxID=518643 RepID=UPI0030ED4FB5
MASDYGFFFPDMGLNKPQGLVSADEEIFSASSVNQAVVRELIQNSLDAKSRNTGRPVKVVFELRNVDTSKIPDYQALCQHILAADHDNRYDSQNSRLHDAARMIQQSQIPVLRVGDYRTTGLSGSESILPLYADSAGVHLGTLLALTYASGFSLGKTDAGGSYGIGKSVGIRASGVRTEFWTTRSENDEKTVLAGYTQLPTHVDPSSGHGVNGQAMFTDRARTKRDNDLHYLRNPGSLMGFPERNDPGTDVYVLGYMDDDPDLDNIRNAVLDNFMAAVNRGNLVVQGIGRSRSWELNIQSLCEFVKDSEAHGAFYNALQQEPILRHDRDLGEMKLYLTVDDSLSRKYDTVVMRKPLMAVRSYTHNSIRTPYAAVFECSSEPGNTVLRKMEPVSHDDWNGSRATNGEAIIKRVKQFIREGIRSRIKDEMGVEINIDDLKRLLPQDMVQAGDPNIHQSGAVIPSVEDSQEEDETSGVHGKPSDELILTNPEHESVHIQLSHPAISEQEGEAVEKGLDSGGAGNRGKHTVGLDGQGKQGNGESRIESGDVTIRTLYRDSDGSYLIILRSLDRPELSGSIRLGATFEGKVNMQYSLKLIEVSDEDDKVHVFPIAGDVISSIEVHRDRPTKLRVRIKGGRKMQLAVI